MPTYVRCCAEWVQGDNPDIPCHNCGTYPIILDDGNGNIIDLTNEAQVSVADGQGTDAATKITEHLYHYWWAYFYLVVIVVSGVLVGYGTFFHAD